jgi:hypothetical protein
MSRCDSLLDYFMPSIHTTSVSNIYIYYSTLDRFRKHGVIVRRGKSHLTLKHYDKISEKVETYTHTYIHTYTHTAPNINITERRFLIFYFLKYS